MSSTPRVKDSSPGRTYPWVVVGLLWVCGFLNYADRQAVFSVLDLLGQEYSLNQTQKGWIGSSFMVVYFLSAPLAGFVVDRVSRRTLITAGVGLWSLICAATGTARSYVELLVYRAAEGLGETFYFPASMSLVADYHGRGTRSRAMGLHQTSVYAGTALGAIAGGFLGQWYGWRSPFWVLGLIGIAYAFVLPWVLVEPKRGASDALDNPKPESDPLAEPLHEETPEALDHGMLVQIGQVVRIPAAVLLLAVFAGANFVAATLLAWLPAFVKAQHALDLSKAATVAGLFFPGGNALGALIGGTMADFASRRFRGGRVLVQACGLILGAPCVWIAGHTHDLSVLIPALVGIGLGKGIYDANIFASLYDVVPTTVRGTAAGLMNTAGWSLGSLAPALVGWLSDRYDQGAVIGWTAVVYLFAGLLAMVASGFVASARRAVV
ncbi:MAG: MFS transporter [Isosphaeraceae bacterium]